jgi:hypothetical protein
MSTYLAQWRLTYDADFTSRQRACLTQQADHWKDDERGDISALAFALLRGDPDALLTFQVMIGASPGFAESVDNGDGTIDSSRVQDGEILATVQALWPTVAAIYFDADGAPK